jgi:hypothetical protein
VTTTSHSWTSTIRLLLAAAVVAVLGGSLLAVAPSASAAPTAPAASSDDRTDRTDRTFRSASETPRNLRGCRVPNCYGSISINVRTGTANGTYNYGMRTRAVNTAYNKCRNRAANEGRAKYCRKAGWVRNGCLAVAYRMNNGRLEWGSAARYGKSAAIRAAKSKVRGPGQEKLWAWVCTTRRR